MIDKQEKTAQQTFAERLAAATIETGTITIEGKEYPYRVCKPDLAPQLKYFVGPRNPSEGLFISSDVPAEFRNAFFLHEVKCAATRGKENNCRDAVEYELWHVPEPDRDRYIRIRTEMFSGLVAAYPADKASSESDAAFRREIAGSLNYLRSLLP